ncbi:2-dehydropantoate 2-reductase [Pontibacillus yanchengensis]|uniref:2-dehydropantoate 2-reductase n=2 Tax=Pontibacillus yanchengensis TaxID=462910 RepID=A0ACC7VC59_9BACI|nr:ketopantoate reductase family protein [Pontibacillus yanchengensis]MYL35324.1 2-dehydropantoate 2-reductase [Pontibacillus yanchengensis]MYL52353.1 2-dehydropantoate 2-reductase [Pontibacillus yanchengensis]
MNITILGAGAIGAYFGVRWEQIGHQVQYLVRSRRSEQLRKHGVHLHSVQGDYTLEQPFVVEDVSDIEFTDLVILAVKGYHLQGAIPELKDLVQKGAKVLPLLNGIEHIYTLQDELGEENVIGGLSYIIATLDEKGHVVHSSQLHDIHFGPLHFSQHELCNQLEHVCADANMRAKQSQHIMEDLWKKYMFITAFSGVTTAGNFTVGTIREEQVTYEATKNVLKEMKILANAFDIPLREESIQAGILKFESLPDEATSSMHQDKRKGLPLEVDHLQGGALRLAQKAGISLPYIHMLYSLIKPYERG